MVTHIGIKTPSIIPKVHLKLERISWRSSRLLVFISWRSWLSSLATLFSRLSILVSRWLSLAPTSSRIPSTLAIRSSSDFLCSMPNLLYHKISGVWGHSPQCSLLIMTTTPADARGFPSGSRSVLGNWAPLSVCPLPRRPACCRQGEDEGEGGLNKAHLKLEMRWNRGKEV